MEIPLFENYSLQQAEDHAAFFAFFDEHVGAMFPGSMWLDLDLVLSKEEKDKSNALSKNTAQLERLNFYIMCGKEKAGWFFGNQIDHETFKMTNTGIFEAHRGKGIYKKLLTVILQLLHEKGFQKVTSRHAATNNRIIIPKLRAGFVISGFEISDYFGTFVHLTYYFNETRRKIVDFRVGEIQPTKEIAEAISLKIG